MSLRERCVGHFLMPSDFDDKYEYFRRYIETCFRTKTLLLKLRRLSEEEERVISQNNFQRLPYDPKEE